MDKVDHIVSILKNNWNSANTKNRTPIIGRIYDYKLIDIRFDDYILCYTGGEDNEPASLGAKNWFRRGNVTIDWRTADEEMHKLIKKEIYRILRENAKGDGYAIMYLLGGENDLSDRSKGLFRGTIEVELHILE